LNSGLANGAIGQASIPTRKKVVWAGRLKNRSIGCSTGFVEGQAGTSSPSPQSQSAPAPLGSTSLIERTIVEAKSLRVSPDHMSSPAFAKHGASGRGPHLSGAACSSKPQLVFVRAALFSCVTKGSTRTGTTRSHQLLGTEYPDTPTTALGLGEGRMRHDSEVALPGENGIAGLSTGK